MFIWKHCGFNIYKLCFIVQVSFEKEKSVLKCLVENFHWMQSFFYEFGWRFEVLFYEVDVQPSVIREYLIEQKNE